MPTVRIQEKNYSESIMVLKLKDGRKYPELLIPHNICFNRDEYVIILCIIKKMDNPDLTFRQVYATNSSCRMCRIPDKIKGQSEAGLQTLRNKKRLSGKMRFTALIA